MARFNLWRKILLIICAGWMSLFLTSCGEPTEEKARDFAIEITEALYDGDIEPMLENVDFSKSKTENELKMKQSMVQGKLYNIVDRNQKVINAHGDVDNISVSEVTLIGDIYKVNMVVTFDDGYVVYEKSKLRWSEEKGQFLVVI